MLYLYKFVLYPSSNIRGVLNYNLQLHRANWFSSAPMHLIAIFAPAFILSLEQRFAGGSCGEPHPDRLLYLQELRKYVFDDYPCGKGNGNNEWREYCSRMKGAVMSKRRVVNASVHAISEIEEVS